MRTCGTGWLTWPQARSAMAGWQGVWVDLSGPHLGELPELAPQTTHIWAWNGPAWARIRVDEGEAVIGLLHPDQCCPTGSSQCRSTPVGEVMTAGTWSEAHIRVADMAGAAWEVLEAQEGIAALFVRLAGAGDGADHETASNLA